MGGVMAENLTREEYYRRKLNEAYAAIEKLTGVRQMPYFSSPILFTPADSDAEHERWKKEQAKWTKS